MLHHLVIPVVWFLGFVGLDAPDVVRHTLGEGCDQLVGLSANLHTCSGWASLCLMSCLGASSRPPLTSSLGHVTEEAADEGIGAILHDLYGVEGCLG